jgi:hypothetical protein
MFSLSFEFILFFRTRDIGNRKNRLNRFANRRKTRCIMRNVSILLLVVLDHSVVSAFAPFRHLPYCSQTTACGFASLPTFRVKHQLLSVATPHTSHENGGGVNQEPQLDPAHPTRRPCTIFLDGVCNMRGVTLKRFLSEISILNPELQELTTLLGGIDTACKTISNTVKRSQLPSPDTPLGYDNNDTDDSVAATSQDEEPHVSSFLYLCFSE